jgi:biopolymer transport protein ExbB
MTRRSTYSVSFQRLIILACGFIAWPVVGIAQDDILGELISDQETQTTQTDDDNQPSEQEVVEQAATVAPEDGTGSEVAAGAEVNQELATDESAGDAGEADTGQGEVVVPDSEEPGAVEEFLNSGALGLLLNGGAFMWPILLMGILAVGVIIERYRTLKMLNADDQQVREQVQQLLFDEKIEDALELCDTQHGPVPAVLSAGLRKYYVLRKLDYDVARTEEQVVKAMDDYSVHIVAGLERHLPVLATVSSAAPMLGFLGTVQGMIVAFQQIVDQMGETNIVEAAASGIQVSLLTTCFGLIVGIPAFVAFNYFTSVINRFVLQVEQSATELIENVSIQLAAAGMDDKSE